nr:TOMM precursor leader peptide-binding protein [Frigoribacterium faeni]
MQIGVEHVHAVVDRVTTGQAAFLSAVAEGRGDGGTSAVVAQVGCDPAEAAELVRRLGAVVVAAPAGGPDRRSRPVVRLAGSGPLADEVGRLVESASVGVLLEDGESAAAAPRPSPAAARHVGVLVAGLVPDPVVSAEWLRRDVPHVVVRTGDRSVRVGPVVVPGATACCRCLHLHDGDRDPAWPAIAGQLLGAPVPPVPLLAARDAAVRAARRAVLLAHDGDEAEGRLDEVVRIDLETLEVSSSVVRPHPGCGCGAPPGTGSDDARRPGPVRSGPTRGAAARARG